MSKTITALIDTINPTGGNGVNESLIFIIIISVLLTLNVMQIPVSSELQYALYTILGYMVGTNVKKGLADKEERDREAS